ncbi:MAG: L,D-transpeptidase [Alphaproteobacteria bacterium]|nr:L,D-transpeptidase [Alphaproteobacteria bacterium]
MSFSRRGILAASLGLLAAPCAVAGAPAAPAPAPAPRKNWVVGQIPDTPFAIDLIDMALVPEDYHRQLVAFSGPEPAGSIVVDAAKRHLFFVLMNGKAVRFGIAVGREGAAWHGTAVVGRKAKWPGWTPTANMRAKNPALPVHQPGGPSNPLGARALYLYKDGRDTLYRIHGTNDPSSIGKSASSGCIRMFNEHVFELFAEVAVGTRVVVR